MIFLFPNLDLKHISYLRLLILHPISPSFDLFDSTTTLTIETFVPCTVHNYDTPLHTINKTP